MANKHSGSPAPFGPDDAHAAQASNAAASPVAKPSGRRAARVAAAQESAQVSADSSAKSAANPSAKTARKSSGKKSKKKPPGNHQKPGGKIFNAIITLCIVAGIMIMSYPVVATVITNKQQYNISEKQRKEVFRDFNKEKIEKQLKNAEKYNETLRYGPILDPFLQRVAPDTPVYEHYLKELQFNGVMATIRIPKINVFMPIYHGTYDDVLDKGVGHLFGSSLPVGGKNTHAVLTAHSGLGNATMFDNIPKLVKGDEIFISVGDRELKYTVTSTEVIDPTDVKSLYIEDGRDMITLITCYPYGINSQRYLVHADRAPLTKADKELLSKPPKFQWFKTWMIWPVVISLVSLALIFWPRKKKKKKDSPRKTAQASAAPIPSEASSVESSASKSPPSDAPASDASAPDVSASDTSVSEASAPAVDSPSSEERRFPRRDRSGRKSLR